MDHFHFKEFCKPLSKGTFLQSNNPIQLVVWEEMFKGFLTLVAMAIRILHRTQLYEGI